jgi:hypothetical protein
MQSTRISGGYETCLIIFSWVLQFLVWGMIVVCALGVDSFLPRIIGLTVTVYVAYVVCALLSRSFSYLYHMNAGNDIFGYMKSLFEKPINVNFLVECYHYRTNWSSKTRSRTKVTTFSGNFLFPYYSWRDISGTFNLTNGIGKSCYFVKLHLGYSLQFADGMTKVDYDMLKEKLYNENKHRDTYITVTPSISIEGFNEFQLVNLGYGTPPMVGVCWYILFIIIPLIEFYKLYVNIFCVTQEFEIIKVVSTRSNLSTETRFEEPRIIILEKDVTISQTNNSLGEKMTDLPTAEELQLAQSYTKQFTRQGTIRLDVTEPNEIIERGQERHDEHHEEQVPLQHSNQQQSNAFQGGNYRV